MAKVRERTPAGVSRVVGRQVRRARELRRFSQDQLSRQLKDYGVDMGQATIARLESGERRITVDEALALAAALGVNPVYLFSGDFTNEPVPVTPRLGHVAPPAVRSWFQGTQPLVGTDQQTYFELIPDEELIARQLRGIEHLRESVRHFVGAVVANDAKEAKYALRLIRTEIERQEEGLELEARRATEKRQEEKHAES